MTAILAGLVLAAGAIPPSPQMCVIDVCLTRLDPAAPRALQGEEIVAEPRVVTAFGRPAFFRLGKLRTEANGITGPGVSPLLDGVELEVIPLQRSGGCVHLEVAGTPTGTGRATRFAANIQPGAKVRFRVQGSAEPLWVVLTAREVEPSGGK